MDVGTATLYMVSLLIYHAHAHRCFMKDTSTRNTILNSTESLVLTYLVCVSTEVAHSFPGCYEEPRCSESSTALGE